MNSNGMNSNGMSMETPKFVIPPRESEQQRLAVDPKLSVWVSANAGSGKTTILTRRVIGLLLGGVDPSRILCLTYTRAAAAEMQNRVFEVLGKWVTLDAQALAKAVEDLEGRRPDAAHLALARRLFARAVETPGGLKIQTIHAFCERLLHLFPFEANVPARFRLMEEAEQGQILENCIAQVQIDALLGADKALEASLARVVAEASVEKFPALIREALKCRAVVAQWAREETDSSEQHSALAEMLGLKQGETEASIAGEILGRAPTDFAVLRWEQKFAGSGKTDLKLARDLDSAFAIVDLAARAEAYMRALLSPGLEVPKFPPTLSVAILFPDIVRQLKEEQERVAGLVQKWLAAGAVARTHALFMIVDQVLARYSDEKRKLAVLDFADVISRTNTLLTRADSAWILYKLDGGIEHLLVDEAQDTSPEQWSILTRLTSDFFSGAGRMASHRTVFAVGDEKQSIYSFQGAAPDAFARQKKLFQKRVEDAQQGFREVKLQLSFRTTDDILRAVDKVFGIEKTFTGLSGDDPVATVHESARKDAPGLVEIWPPEEKAEEEEQDPHAEVDAVSASAPEVRLANRIAGRIAFWLREKKCFANDGKRIRAGDVMVLVRSRSTFFNATIRALKQAGVPVAGADTLKLTDHIAVMDLIALGESSLLPEDDLTLANLLKSPLVGLGDEDLVTIAARRGDMSLADALANDPRYADAWTQVERWRWMARELDPFRFYSTVLGAEGGRKRLLARLGMDAAEAIDVFLSDTLDWQTRNTPSLFQFLQGLRHSERIVKRQFDSNLDAVRIMTVHAAKGLEARIVFLGDTHGTPAATHGPKLFKLCELDEVRQWPEVVVWSPRKETDTAEIAKIREQEKQHSFEEYRRLLYVGMTRARDRLYIAGFKGKQKTSGEAWYSLIEQTLGDDIHLKEVEAEDDSGPVLQWRTVRTPDRPPLQRLDEGLEKRWMPDWLHNPLPVELPELPPLRPSRAAQAAEQEKLDPDQLRAQGKSRQRGILIHYLLQHLPAIAAPRRDEVARRLLALKAGDLSETERNEIRDACLNLFLSSELTGILGSKSRAEVDIHGTIRMMDGTMRAVTARIDRILVTGSEVIIADFKTGRAPKNPKNIPAGILGQLAIYRALLAEIYPDKQIRAGVIWTAIPAIALASEASLDEAFSNITFG